jgi:hypothetical protein
MLATTNTAASSTSTDAPLVKIANTFSSRRPLSR